MAITFVDYNSPGDAHPLANDDIVGFVGVNGGTVQDGNGAALTYDTNNSSIVFHSRDFDALAGANKPAGSSGAAYNDLQGIMRQWGGEVVMSVLNHGANITEANVDAAIDKVMGYQDTPTVLIVAGDLANYGADDTAIVHAGNAGTLAAKSTAKSGITAHLEGLAEDFLVRAMVKADQDSLADNKTWMTANRGNRVMPWINDLGNHGAASVGLGAGLRARARFGRGTGINGFQIVGLGGSLDNLWTPVNSDATVIASGDAGVLVNDEGVIEVLTGADGEFYYATTDLQRYWEVAFQVDYIKRALRFHGRSYLSRGDLSQEDLGALLQHHADVLVRGRNAREILIAPYPGSTGVDRKFELDIHPYFAIRNIEFHTRVIDSITL